MDKQIRTNAKTWEKPVLTVHGDVVKLTQQTKLKTYGSSDDFAINICTVDVNCPSSVV